MILKQTEVKVNPDFNNLKLDIDFTCILSLRYVHIIIGYIIIVFSFIGSIFKIKVLSDRLNTNY